ncbi:hypothetical protein L228DRAFT_7228 [Xylona heveae TC161]|uniref:Cytidyltransferase-like domain-containing protein n=1 Tax=Xylona heveae (strain CBS 132557 / TC161) TaxID=1328760 RepID=A0A165JG20_XYLHT|nr:hypothetical protein L228DRAFT_7228 [Xylona heveae TC161]KZF26188.1 hypothetical protein L228DRAFT_7228 [Xylona heveae TC161]
MADSSPSVPKALLLLPPPPHPSAYSGLEASYRPPLSSSLRAVSKMPNSSSDAAILDIALPCPHLADRVARPRSKSYAQTQKLLAAVYKIICVICAQDSIELEGAGGVDFRVLLVALDREDGSVSEPQIPYGPVIDLPTLALHPERWHKLFSTEGEPGEGLLQQFSRLAAHNPRAPKGNLPVERVPGGIGLIHPGSNLQTDIGAVDIPHREYSAAAVGGTFDHLHAGHKLLLTMTAFLLEPDAQSHSMPRRLIVGITGEELLKNKKYAEFLEGWETRQQRVGAFLQATLGFPFTDQTLFREVRCDGSEPNEKVVKKHLGPNFIVECVEISDPFGPTITDESISALVVSAETRSGGKAVNTKRAERGWPDLAVFEVDVLDAEIGTASDSGKDAKLSEEYATKISSTGIRQQKAANAAKATAG